MAALASPSCWITNSNIDGTSDQRIGYIGGDLVSGYDGQRSTSQLLEIRNYADRDGFEAMELI
jgi:hypothetical protein